SLLEQGAHETSVLVGVRGRHAFSLHHDAAVHSNIAVVHLDAPSHDVTAAADGGPMYTPTLAVALLGVLCAAPAWADTTWPTHDLHRQSSIASTGAKHVRALAVAPSGMATLRQGAGAPAR